jgi:hypothetical protein
MSSRDAKEPPADAGGAEEFARLLTGHANRELTAAEDERLRRLAAGDARRGQAVAEIEQVHELFRAERELRAATEEPLAATAELDGTWQRLQRAAAAGEQELRARLRRAPAAGSFAGAGRRRSRLLAGALALAAAAALVAGLLLLQDRGDAPPLIPRAPGAGELGGGAVVLLEPEIRAEEPAVAWHPVPGALAYEVVAVDAGGKVLAQRAEERAKSTRWDLTAGEYERLRAARGALFLRVMARDGAGIPIATSGDLVLTLR